MPAGYRLYAASPADFVGAGQVGAPLILASATLTVHSAVTSGTQITDLLNAAEGAATTVATDDFGNFRFYAVDTLGTLWVSAGGATRYAVQPADIGTLVNGLAAAPASAAAAATSAAVSLAAIQGLSASIDADLVAIQEEASAATLAAQAATKTAVPVRWEFDGPAELAAGITGEWHRLHTSAKIVGVSAFLDGAPLTATQVDLEYAPGALGSSAAQNLYGVTKGTLAGGLALGDLALPVTTVLLQGAIRPRVVVAPPVPSGVASAATVQAVTPYTSGANALSTHPVPRPTGGQAGDHVVVICSTSNSPTSMPAGGGYSQVLEQITDLTTPQNRLTIFTAPWSSGLVAPTATVTGGASPMVAVACLVRSADSANPILGFASAGQNSAGASFASPAHSVPAGGTDLELVVFSTRFGSNIDNWTINATGGPTGLTEISDQVTTRLAATNQGLWVGRASAALAAAAAVPVATATVTGGTGSTTNVSWNAAVLTIKKGSGSAGASRLELQVSFQ